MRFAFVLLATVASQASFASAPDYQAAFGEREGCFLLTDLATGKVIEEFNPKRCAERLSPCSSFKIAAALMAFDRGTLQNENHVIVWDGVKRDREELNQNQTPYTWMKHSAMWVTQWLTPQWGVDGVKHYLRKFKYGNEDFSGGVTRAWQTSTLRISAHEQARFVRKLWSDSLPVSKWALELTRKIMFIKKLAPEAELFGKTGTGCIDADCDTAPGKRMIGWFVGVLKRGDRGYAFAANASDIVPPADGRPAGPRLRQTVIELLGKRSRN